jgi:hypothetical protein
MNACRPGFGFESTSEARIVNRQGGPNKGAARIRSRPTRSPPKTSSRNLRPPTRSSSRTMAQRAATRISIGIQLMTQEIANQDDQPGSWPDRSSADRAPGAEIHRERPIVSGAHGTAERIYLLVAATGAIKRGGPWHSFHWFRSEVRYSGCDPAFACEVTMTFSPCASESGGLMTKASSAASPPRTSMLLPRSCPIVSFLKSM